MEAALRDRTLPAGVRPDNGGFPLPVTGEPENVVAVNHSCGARTRIRLPRALPERAVNRVVCGGCREIFPPAAVVPETADAVATPSEPKPLPSPEPVAAPAAGPALPAPVAATAPVPVPAPPPSSPPAKPVATEPAEPAMPGRAPRSRKLRRWASAPLMLAAVIAGLALIQGGGGDAPAPASNSPVATPTSGGAELVEGPGYSLALPEGWQEIQPPKGATFAAQAEDGLGDATLWIEKAPDLSFADFEERSLAQLSELADNARVVDRVDGPSLESQIVELQADAPLADGVSSPYSVTLRAAGPYRLYFATVVQPGAPAQLRGDTELMANSLRPDVRVEGLDEGSAP